MKSKINPRRSAAAAFAAFLSLAADWSFLPTASSQNNEAKNSGGRTQQVYENFDIRDEHVRGKNAVFARESEKSNTAKQSEIARRNEQMVGIFRWRPARLPCPGACR